MTIKNLFKRKQPKYELGDIVRFVTDFDTVWTGRIWKIHTYLLCEASYEVFQHWGFGIGINFCVSESDIIEILSQVGRTDNPFNPIKK